MEVIGVFSVIKALKKRVFMVYFLVVKLRNVKLALVVAVLKRVKNMEVNQILEVF